MKRNVVVSSIIGLVIGLLSLGMFANCSDTPNEDIWGVNTQGVRVKLDPSKVCWSTYEPIPKDVEVIADPVNDRFVYRKLRATATKGTSYEIEPEDGSGGGCTCSCSTGHCSPAILQGSCVCVIQEGCSQCTRSASI